MLEFLPDYIKIALQHLNQTFLYEIRLRADKPVSVNYKGEYLYLTALGVSAYPQNALLINGEELFDCVYKAGNYSVYAIEEQIKRGFITTKHGVRLGLAGEYVYENGKVLTIRSLTSLCIRVPHEIYGCADKIFEICMSNRVRNLLICSPAGLGKTTILRALSRKIAETSRKNILICDERGEIANGNIGNWCDVLKFADKTTAFEAGIRALRPDIIITDELLEEDCKALKKAISAGVKVIATAHFYAMEEIKSPFLGIFERYVLLDQEKIGEMQGIYNQNGEKIC